MLYRSGRTTGLRVVQWLTRDGKTESLWEDPAFYQIPRLSPDGSRLASVLTAGSNSDIWVYDWRRGSRTRLTEPPGVNTSPRWSPDGQYVVFQSAGRLFWTRADGAERPQPLTKGQNLQFPESFTPDGKRLAFSEQGREAELSYGPCRLRAPPAACEPGSQSCFIEHRQAIPIRLFPQTDTGWPMRHLNRASMRSMCARFPTADDNGRSRRMEEHCRCGRAAGTNCSIEPKTIA